MFDKDLLPFIAKLDPTIMWIALTVGLILFVIGYFAGGRLQMAKIFITMTVVTVVSVLALPAPMLLFRVMKQQYNVKTVYLGQQGGGNAGESPAANQPENEEQQGAGGEESPESGVPMPFQILTLILHIAWSAFLVGMAIFLYETFITTAQEAEPR